MKTQTVIATAAGRPLRILSVDLDGACAGEGLIEIKAYEIAHAEEFTRSDAATEGLFAESRVHAHADIEVHLSPVVNLAFDLTQRGQFIRSVALFS